MMLAAGRLYVLPIVATSVVAAAVFLSVLFNSNSQGGWNKEPEDGSSGNEEMDLPVLAFSITGTSGDAHRIFRLLLAIYHPRHGYVIHLESATPPGERDELAGLIQSAANGVMSRVGNVRLIPREKSAAVTYRGVTMLAAYLNCAAILLDWNDAWDWFVLLSASDYPLVTPDDLIQSLSIVPREANFVSLSSKVNRRRLFRTIAVDPALYTPPRTFSEGDEAFKKKPALSLKLRKPKVPTNFRVFEGSAWVVLSRSFVEYITLGFDNLPRLLLLHFANILSNPEHYFHTVICNSPFNKTVLNDDLHLIKWHTPPRQHPKSLTEENFEELVNCRRPFARKFAGNATVLDKIDKELLGREEKNTLVEGGWCAGIEGDHCSEVGDIDKLRVTEGAARIMPFLRDLIKRRNSEGSDCLRERSY